MAKSVTFNPNPRKRPDPADLDAFVQGRGGKADRAAPESLPLPALEPPAPKMPMKRLTFDIDAALHRRIRINCVERGIDMAEDLRRILEKHYPSK